MSDKGPKLKSVFLRPLSSIVAKGDELRNRRNEVKERTRKKKKKSSSCTLSFHNIYFVLLSWARKNNLKKKIIIMIIYYNLSGCGALAQTK